MLEAQTCAQCGGELSANALGGLCVKCLAQMALMKHGTPERASAPAGPSFEQLGERIGHYKLLRILGEGGCGIVYLAEQQAPVRRQVAVKIIKLGMDTKEVIVRFEAERQALALMDHSNIAKVLDAGTTQSGRPYFVMELVEGVPITRYCDENNLSTAARLRLFRRVCQAIQHAHQKGVIHRDIKPSNILVAARDDQAEPKIIDFGIAKATTGQRLTDATFYTAFEQFIGTPAYMSPEQAAMSGTDVDTRSDIYSLGVLLYELLTGKIPFEAQKLMKAGLDEMRRVIREEEPMRPSTRVLSLASAEQDTVARNRQLDSPKLGHLLRGDLDWIVMKALEKDRERRYETANGLGKDVQRYLENEPVAARPPSRIYRFRKVVRRNKLAFGAAACVTTSLVLGLASSSFLLVREREARANESVLRRQADKANQQAQEQAHRAEISALESKNTLSASDFLQGCRLQSEGRLSDALAYFTRSLSANPSNHAALTRLANTLANHCWAVPVRLFKPAYAAQYSPDGASILTVARDGTSRLWNSQTGLPLAESGRFGTNVQAAQFSPDGKLILTVMLDGTLWLWDAQTGESTTDPSRFGKGIRWAQFSPDSKHILTTSINRIRMSAPGKQDVQSGNVWSSEIVGYTSDQTMKLWNTDGGGPVAESSKQNGLVDTARFAPDGRSIITLGPEGSTRFWDAQTLQPLAAPFTCTNIESLQFSSDGRQIIAVSRDGTARVLDAHEATPKANPLKTADNITSACFNSQGNRLVTTAADGTLRIWDARDGRPLTEPFKHGDWVNSDQFSPDGKRVLTASSDDSAIEWAIVSGPPGTQVLRHGAEVNSARFSADGSRILTASSDKTARIWDALSGEPVNQPLQHQGAVFSAEFSPDSRQVITTSEDTPARIWEAQSARPLVVVSKPPPPGSPTTLAPPAQPTGLRIIDAREPSPDEISEKLIPQNLAKLSPDGTRILTVSSWESTARVWDARTGALLIEPLTNDGIVTVAQFSPDSRRIVTATQTGSIQLWDAQTGRPLSNPWHHDAWVVTALFSPDGTRILTASGDKTARIWDVQTGRQLTPPLKHARPLTSAQFSPDGTRIVTTSDDGTARIWDAQDGQPTTEPLLHGTNVTDAQFSADGRQVLTVAGDGALRVWDAETGQPLTDCLPGEGIVHAGRFSPDGTRLLAASSNGTAQIWDIAPAPNRCPPWLLRLAEVISGKLLNKQGILQTTPLNRPEMIRQIRAELDGDQIADDWTRWGRWFLADPAARTISPFTSARVHGQSPDLKK